MQPPLPGSQDNATSVQWEYADSGFCDESPLEQQVYLDWIPPTNRKRHPAGEGTFCSFPPPKPPPPPPPPHVLNATIDFSLFHARSETQFPLPQSYTGPLSTSLPCATWSSDFRVPNTDFQTSQNQCSVPQSTTFPCSTSVPSSSGIRHEPTSREAVPSPTSTFSEPVGAYLMQRYLNDSGAGRGVGEPPSQ